MKNFISVVLLVLYFVLDKLNFKYWRLVCLTKFAEQWIGNFFEYQFGLMSHGTESSSKIKTLWMVGPESISPIGIKYASDLKMEKLLLRSLILCSEFPYKIFWEVF